MASLKSLLTSTFLSVLSCWCLGNAGPRLSHAQIINTIKPGEVLGYSQHLVSNDGEFQLGFNSTDLVGGYLAIWYTNDGYQSKLWIANRDTPIQASQANLTMDADGLLKIVHDGEGSPIVLNANEAAPNSIATLENSGNFMVKELNSDGSTKRILWQSFDHPTDTLLPGMKLGFNFKTQQKWMLTSWLTDRIPAPGGFSLEWEPMENGTGQLVMRHRGDMYWVSGVGRNSDFENVPTTIYYNFSYVSNENESYVSYSTPGRNFSRWNLDSDGQLTNDPKPIYVTSGMCFGYSSDTGCVEQNAPTCRNINRKFEKRYGYFSPAESPRLDDNSSISIGDCWAQCRSNCSCVGFDTIPNNETGCRFYTGRFVENQAYDDYPQLYVLIETGKHPHPQPRSRA
jgi:hypothetical protein